MPGTLQIGTDTYPFDEEIFAARWGAQDDPVTNALLASGAMVEDGYIAGLIANGSNQYTVPFYGLLADDDDDNYDGNTDITTGTIGASSQTGVVYGRAHAWEAVQFIADFTTAQPMAAIAARTAKYWANKRQKRLIGILEAVTELDGMKDHKLTLNELEPTSVTDAAQAIFGEHADKVAMVIMHSAVAQQFKRWRILNNWDDTTPDAVTRDAGLYAINGIPVIIDDGLPKTAASGSGESAKAATYTTYLLGAGAIRHASAPVTLPVELWREPLSKGGKDYIINRLRGTIHPDGFNFSLGTGTGWSESPTDAQLSAKANWSLAYDAASVPIAKMVTPAAMAE